LSALQNLFQNFINQWIISFVTSAINFFTANYTGILQQSGAILQDRNIRTVMFTVQAFALAVLVVRVGYEILNTYLLHMAGDSTADPKGVLFRTAKASAFIMGVPWAVGYMYQISISMANDVGSVGALQPASNPFTSAASMLAGGEIVFVLMLLVAFIIYILINIQMACRAVEIAVLAMVGPLMAIGFVSPTEGLGGAWWKELVVQCMAQPLQVLMLRLALIAMGNGTINLNGVTVFFIIGWFWVTYKSPKIVQQFAMSTGIGSAAAGTAQTVGKYAVSALS
jgi:hypothetical protein